MLLSGFLLLSCNLNTFPLQCHSLWFVSQLTFQLCYVILSFILLPQSSPPIDPFSFVTCDLEEVGQDHMMNKLLTLAKKTLHILHLFFVERFVCAPTKWHHQRLFSDMEPKKSPLGIKRGRIFSLTTGKTPHQRCK